MEGHSPRVAVSSFRDSPITLSARHYRAGLQAVSSLRYRFVADLPWVAPAPRAGRRFNKPFAIQKGWPGSGLTGREEVSYCSVLEAVEVRFSRALIKEALRG
jgi:hypothetical protein